MPIETEYKYVLNHVEGLEARLLEVAPLFHYSVVDIRQGYLTKGNRLREYSWVVDDGLILHRPKVEKVRTFKLPLKDKASCLEWEDPIADDEFEMAWEMTECPIVKRRFILAWNDKLKWELDFFKKDDYTYLTMAECEVFDGSGAPTELPEIVRTHLLFAVPEDDNRFQNRKLSEVERVRKVLNELGAK